MTFLHAMRLSRGVVVATALLTFALPISSVYAEPSAQDRASARSLAEEGQKKLDEGDFKTALDLLSRADSLVPAPTVKVRIAKAHEGLGHLLEAYEILTAVSREPSAPSDPAWYKEARTKASGDAAKIYTRLGALTLNITPDASRASVLVDGAPLAAALIGVPAKFNPGKHKLVVEAPGFESISQEFTLQEGQGITLSLSMKRREPTTATPEPVKEAKVVLLLRGSSGVVQNAKISIDGQSFPDAASIPPQRVGEHKLHVEASGFDSVDSTFEIKNAEPFDLVVQLVQSAPTPPATSPSPPTRSHSLAIAGFSVGAAGIIVGGITGALSLATVGDLKSACPGQVCPASKQDSIDHAKTLGTISTVGFIVGGVGVGVGVFDLLRGGASSRSESAASQTRPTSKPSALSVNVGPGSLWLSGGF